MKKFCLHCLVLSLLLMASLAVKAQTSSTYFISKDSANLMLESYLESIPAGEHDQYLRSLVLDAAAIRSYLADTSIQKVKLMLAHTKAFSKTREADLPPDLKSGGITLVLVGVDAAGNYKLYGGNTLVNFATLCPPSCYLSGSAAADDIP